ncbi:MAG: hypothetical protein HC913_04485 [Microscillaceae bacterium]|nr:hypothetical protein [Microscillaceae bacterium]
MENQNPENPEAEIPAGRRGDCQKGFFVLRRCEKPAMAKCALTRRFVCEDCAVKYEDKWVNREAYAQEMQRQNKPRPTYEQEMNRWQTRDDVDYALWYYYMRDDFYTSQGFEPFSGSDESSFGGGEFGGAGAEGGWDDESGPGGLYDS